MFCDFCVDIYAFQGFPGGSVVKNLAANARDAGNVGSVPGSGRSPGERNSNPSQYSCLENPMDRGAWWATVPGVPKTQTQLSTCAYSTHLKKQSPLSDFTDRLWLRKLFNLARLWGFVPRCPRCPVFFLLSLSSLSLLSLFSLSLSVSQWSCSLLLPLVSNYTAANCSQMNFFSDSITFWLTQVNFQEMWVTLRN